MSVQQAVEAANFNSYQMRASFGEHESHPGGLLLNEQTPPWVRAELSKMGYTLTFEQRRPGRSTRSSSTASTAASGAARATMATTMAWSGSREGRPLS